MFHIEFKFEDIEILSIEKQDLGNIYEWYVNEELEKGQCGNNSVCEKDFYERFLEYYFSECEFFLKINRKKNLIGIVKGRIEFKNPNKVWITYIMVDHPLRGDGLGSKILNKVINYFVSEYGICKFYVKVGENDEECIDFLKKNGFRIIRFTIEKSVSMSSSSFIIFSKTI
ncbi:GNAT family N-acetyltransferase [Clostridium sp. MB40-C1]|uniref:GNAT family N-acetyltransferase n=1 Tax=Clostridium sp. MB40-C1 TaxID=3070996 RepID=UPI0027E189CE|nr:GNAT family N-acetyltransferase [Clostridium sp. MB40-C1]WMJ81031.1 GNAT family N-acetyltransferase [Clostridium sp. MB40-C1]